MTLVRPTKEKPPEGSPARVMEKAWEELITKGRRAVAAELAQLLQSTAGYVIIDPESNQWPSRLLSFGQPLLRPADLSYSSSYGKLRVSGKQGEVLAFTASARAAEKVDQLLSESEDDWRAQNRLVVEVVFGNRMEILASTPIGLTVEYQDLLQEGDIALPGFAVREEGRYRVQQLGEWKARLPEGARSPAEAIRFFRRLDFVGTPLSGYE